MSCQHVSEEDAVPRPTGRENSLPKGSSSNEGRGYPSPQSAPHPFPRAGAGRCSVPYPGTEEIKPSLWRPGSRSWPGHSPCHGWAQLVFSHLLGFKFLPRSPSQSLLLLFPGFSQEFLKFATTEAIQRTEIFEYCQMLGRPQSFIPSFQVTDPRG